MKTKKEGQEENGGQRRKRCVRTGVGGGRAEGEDGRKKGIGDRQEMTR